MNEQSQFSGAGTNPRPPVQQVDINNITPMQAINIIAPLLKESRLTFNDHLVVGRCVDVLFNLAQNAGSPSDFNSAPSFTPPDFNSPS